MIMRLSKILFPTLRIPTVTRISLDRTLIPLLSRLKPGIVLDVGSKASPYRKWIPSSTYLRLDISHSSAPDICCDLHAIRWEDGYFDTCIATEVLEHLHDPQIAVDEIFRVMKPGGVCIASTRFMYPYHPDPNDYYRYTWDSLRHLFRNFSNVEVFHHGNKLQVLWQLINNKGYPTIIFNLLNPLIARVHVRKTKYPLGFVLVAQK